MKTGKTSTRSEIFADIEKHRCGADRQARPLRNDEIIARLNGFAARVPDLEFYAIYDHECDGGNSSREGLRCGPTCRSEILAQDEELEPGQNLVGPVVRHLMTVPDRYTAFMVNSVGELWHSVIDVRLDVARQRVYLVGSSDEGEEVVEGQL